MTSYTNVFGSDTIPPAGQGYRLITLTDHVALQWPANYEGPDYLADLNHVTASVTGWRITLPPANAESPGRDFIIRNVGLYAFQVNDNKGVPVAVINPGEVKYFYIVDNSTDSGVWSVFTYGTGTSQADASLLKGYGLTITGSSLSTAHPVVITASDVFVAQGDRANVFVFTAGSNTLTLPGVLTVGDNFHLAVRNAGSGTITIKPSGADVIDNVSTVTLAPGESVFIFCSGSTWFTVGYGRSVQFQFTKLVKDITAGGSFTLTSGEAANKLLQFVGTPGSNVTVNVPAIVAVYYVQNSYSGAPTLTVKTASGTGVTLVNNDKVILFCDGVNIVAATPVAGGGGGGGGGGGVINYGDGTAAAPAITFSSDTDTGLYLIAPNTMGVSANGVEVARFGATSSSVVGNFGIGTNSPTAKLDVRGAGELNGNTADLSGGLPSGVMLQIGAAENSPTRVMIDGYGPGTAPYLTLRTSNGSLATPSATSLGNNLGNVSFRGRGATQWSGDRAYMIARASENWSDAAQGTFLLWAVTPTGSTTPLVKMVLDQNGWLTVGADTTPTAPLLVVGNSIIQGSVICKIIAASSNDGRFPFQCENASASNHSMIQFRYTDAGNNTHDVGYQCADDTYPFIIIAKDQSTEALKVNNSGQAYSNGWNTPSDERFKEDWSTMPGDLLEQLSSVLRGTYTDKRTGERCLGVGAGSLRKIILEATQEDEKGFLSVSYGNAALVVALEIADRLLRLEKFVRNTC